MLDAVVVAYDSQASFPPKLSLQLYYSDCQGGGVQTGTGDHYQLGS